MVINDDVDLIKLKILSLNVCGLVSKLHNPDFVEFLSLYDIICLTETKIDKIDDVVLEGYELLPPICRSQCKVRSGGICVFVRNDRCKYVHVSEPVTCHSQCILWFDIDDKLLPNKTLFGTVYIPPEGSNYSNIDMFAEIESRLLDFDGPICLLGDFNAHTGNLDDYINVDNDILDALNIHDDDQMVMNKLHILNECGVPFKRLSQDTHRVDNYGHKLLNLCKSVDLFIVNGRIGHDQNIGHTTCNNSVIDYAIVSPELFRSVFDFNVLPFDPVLSDVHNPLCLSLCCKTNNLDLNIDVSVDNLDSIDINNVHSNNTNVKPRWNNGRLPDFVANIDDVKVQELLDRLDGIDPQSIDTDICNGLIEDCNTIIKTAAERSDMFVNFENNMCKKSLKCRSTCSKRYFNSECYVKRKDYRKSKKYYYRLRTNDAHSDMVCKSKVYKKTLQKQFKEFQKSFIDKLRSLRTSDPKAYWSLLNRGYDKSVKNATSSKVAMDVFFNHFKNLNTVQDNVDVVLPDNISQYNEVLNQPFVEKEVLEAIKSLKNNKACGGDLILNEFLKHSADKLMPVFVKIFNIVFESGIIPQYWSEGYICPIYKNKGDRANADNYRGITILSCFGKLFTCILNNRLFNYLESLGLLCEEQAGFRKGYSTVDHIFNLKCIIDLYLFRRKKLYCAFIDYRKAFDSVDRTLLWQKLLRTTIDGKILIVIQNLYKNAKSCVREGFNCSDFFTSNIGVRQGENLSPLLFSIFLNDLVDFLSHSYNGLTDICNISHLVFDDSEIEVFFKLYLLLYADDTVILAESAAELQSSLNAMYLYCQSWNLKVNADKTKVVIFSKCRNEDNVNFQFNGKQLSVVDDFQYLGILFSRKGSFQLNKARLVQQARKAMFYVLRKSRKLCLPIDILLQLFDAMIAPILMYGAEVWGYENDNIIEALHLEFCKCILKVKKCTPNCVVYGELGRVPMSVHISARMIGFWERIVSGKHEKIAYTLYKILYRLDQGNVYHSKWLNCVKDILDKTGFINCWNDQIVNKNFNLSRKVKQSLHDTFVVSWKNEVYNLSKCTNYRMYKSTFGLEKYLTILPQDLLYNFCRFRCSSHRLPIETGRFFSIDRSERICDLCSKHELGDEFHYIFNCTFFKDERSKYLPKRLVGCPNALTYNELMNSDDKYVLIGLAKFCKIVMSIFK